jgi:predicted nucleic acid-binding protein
MPPTVPIVPPEVFIDSGGFIALHVPTDAHHSDAIARRDATLRFSRLYTSSAVVAETVAHIQRDNLLDQNNLDSLINDFLKSEKWISFLPVDDEVLEKALRMVKGKRHANCSLVDATNVMLMEKHRIDIIFSFDAFYDGISVQRGYNSRLLQRVY